MGLNDLKDRKGKGKVQNKPGPEGADFQQKYTSTPF